MVRIMGYCIIYDWGKFGSAKDDSDEVSETKIVYQNNPWHDSKIINPHWHGIGKDINEYWRVVDEKHVGAILAEHVITKKSLVKIIDSHKYDIWE